MKLKNATQLAIMGVLFIILPTIGYLLTSLEILPYINPETREVMWYMKYSALPNIIGFTLLLLFFITLLKSQQ